MKYDNKGVASIDCSELCDLLYQKPNLDISRFHVVDPEQYNSSIAKLFAPYTILSKYIYNDTTTIEEFDATNQQSWHFPEDYQNLDIAAWVLDQCNSDAELQRCGQELLMYQERDAFTLLKYMKFLVDTMRKNKIVWGVGRGSSVASFVLYKIGVHKINSLYYDLDITEFLK